MLLEKVLLWFLGPSNKYSPRDIIPLTNSCLSKLPCGYLILVRKSPCVFSSCLCCCFQSKVLLAIWILSFKGAFFAVDWALQRVLNNSQRTMLSRGRMIWLLGHPLPPSLVSKLGRRHTGRLRKRDNLADGRGGGRGAESSDRKKAWSSINPSILSGPQYSQRYVTSWFLVIQLKKNSDSSCRKSNLTYTLVIYYNVKRSFAIL
jgi:hypothetical protein